jgi:hypothetical protein
MVLFCLSSSFRLFPRVQKTYDVNRSGERFKFTHEYSRGGPVGGRWDHTTQVLVCVCVLVKLNKMNAARDSGNMIQQPLS